MKWSEEEEEVVLLEVGRKQVLYCVGSWSVLMELLVWTL